MKTEIESRLDYLRNEIQNERISYSEIAELQSLAGHIDPSDTELLQWAIQKTPEMTDRPDCWGVGELMAFVTCPTCKGTGYVPEES